MLRTRSLLFTPATRRDRMQKALASQADVVVFDLEDGRIGTPYAEAVDHLNATLAPRTLARPTRPVAVRLDPHHPEPLVAHEYPLVLPKCDSLGHVSEWATRLAMRSKKRPQLWPCIESAAGLLAAREIAAHPDVVGLILGTSDLQYDLRQLHHTYTLNHAPLVLLAAKAAGKRAIIYDPSMHEQESISSMWAYQYFCRGWDGACILTPTLAAKVNAGFMLGHDEVTAFERIARDTDLTVHYSDGQLVAPPQRRLAARFLARHKLYAEGDV